MIPPNSVFSWVKVKMNHETVRLGQVFIGKVGPLVLLGILGEEVKSSELKK